MSIDKDLIHRLTLEELAQVISDEDLEYLKTIMRENPEAFNIWMETRSVLNTPDVQAFLARPRPVEDIFLQPLHRRKFGLWAFSMSIAALLIISFGIYSILRSTPEVISTASNANKNVLLQLPGGENIDLSQKQGAVKTGDITLNNTNKALTYTAGTTSQIATLNVPAGKDYRINLSDGTEVWLNSSTTLKFPLAFTGHNREITIQGEAFLKVSKNTKPFLVHLPDNTTVEVLGTEFNVNTYDDVQVALVSGAVKMNAVNKSKLLQPGQEITYTAANGMHVSSFDEDMLLSWKRGLYIFNDIPLAEVIKVFPRWFGKEVIIDSPIRKNARFTGVINRNEPVSVSLDLLKVISDFEYTIDGDVIHIK